MPHPVLYLHQLLPGDGYQQMSFASVLTFLPANNSLTTQIIAPSVLLIISRHKPHRKHRSSVTVYTVACAATDANRTENSTPLLLFTGRSVIICFAVVA
jgi:hypothetical protein